MTRTTLALVIMLLLSAGSLHCMKGVISPRTLTPVETDLPDEELAILDWRDCQNEPYCITSIDGHDNPGDRTYYGRARLLPGRHEIAYRDMGGSRMRGGAPITIGVWGVAVLDLEAGHFYRVRGELCHGEGWGHGYQEWSTLWITDETTREEIYRHRASCKPPANDPTPPYPWQHGVHVVKPEAQEQKYEQDRAECIRQVGELRARYVEELDRREIAFGRCMEALGYEVKYHDLDQLLE